MQFPTLNPHSKTPNQNPFSSLLSNPPWKSHLESAIQTLRTQADQLLRSAAGAPPFARIIGGGGGGGGAHRFDLAMSTAAIEERLAGVPVYALSNAAEEFVLVSGVRTGKSLGLFCFKREDAEALLGQMKSMNRDMREGSRVVAVALNKVCQLKVDGVAFRFIPDSHQVVNAIKEKEKVGSVVEDFPGVPVFQSRSLVLRSHGKRYRPVFFRKEDLEDSLHRASRQQMQLNPAFRRGDIQVCVLEEIISAMKESSSSKWDDVVFIPPGFNVSTDLSEERPAATA